MENEDLIRRLCQRLKLQYLAVMAVLILVVVLCETDLLPIGFFAGSQQAEFWLLLLMEPLTLAAIVAALYLFKSKKVAAALHSGGIAALDRWATLRLLMLQVPLMLNTVGYYLFLVPSFGYMAIMTLLAMCFVYPSLARCKSEVGATHQSHQAQTTKRPI